MAWSFDLEFLASNWTCIWGNGCKGILDHDAEHLGQGCCSVGAELLDVDEAMQIAALGATIDPARFQFHAEAANGVLVGTGDGQTSNTRVVEGACIFLNRPGFAGGAGCALHLQAEADGEQPIDWKPSVCWQLPLRVERSLGDLDGDVEDVAHLRRWGRADWGDEGATMAWCCTEGDRAYVGDQPVVDSLRVEIEALVGHEVYVELRRRVLE
ncbi:MAG: hypothetical protein ACI8TP_004835 [Acidimicrobiales bacterium]|jgi:hypothetical protein